MKAKEVEGWGAGRGEKGKTKLTAMEAALGFAAIFSRSCRAFSARSFLVYSIEAGVPGLGTALGWGRAVRSCPVAGSMGAERRRRNEKKMIGSRNGRMYLQACPLAQKKGESKYVSALRAGWCGWWCARVGWRRMVVPRGDELVGR